MARGARILMASKPDDGAGNLKSAFLFGKIRKFKYSVFNLALGAELRGGSCAGTFWAAALGMWFFFSGTRSVRWYVAAPYMLAACGTCSSLCGLRRYVAAPYTQHSVMNAAPYKRPAVVSGSSDSGALVCV